MSTEDDEQEAFLKRAVTNIKNSTKMSKRQWFVLLCLYVMYLMAGAAIFYYIESKEESKKAENELVERKNLEVLLRDHFSGNYSVRKRLFKSLSDYCGKPLSINMSEDPYMYRWDYYHSVFFVITVVSTIGYGNLAPTTMFTRIFMIFYGLIGIPMNGIVIFTLGEFFGKSFTKLHQRWKNSKLEAKLNYDTAKLGLIGQVILYLIPGFTFFIFLPSTIMTLFEGWEYDVSVYYSFVSLTTIGFGDYVAGVEDSRGFGHLYFVYKIFLLVWIIGGMGFVAMVLSFITHGMRSKRIKKIEHMLTENIKNTPKKLRSELRSLLQEFIFLRVKPVYKGEFEYIPHMIERSQSCPDLLMYQQVSPRMGRKRAMSECYRAVTLQQVQSDTDLNRIDKERTFMPSNELIEQTDLLFKLVNALSCESIHGQQDTEGGGVHGFSDKNILASEYYDPGITQMKTPNRKNRRAISDIRPPSMLLHEAVNGNTWYGADAEEAISEYRKRQRAKSVFEVRKTKDENIFRKIRNRIMSRDETNKDVEKQKIPSEMERARSETPPNVYTRRGSVMSQAQDHILEQTSIADFIRALSAIATTDNLQESETLEQAPKSRRHGVTIMPTRRSSLIPEQTACDAVTRRRFSLKPSDENLLQDNVRKKERRRKVSVGFQDERRSSLLFESNNIPPTVQENVLFTSSSPTITEARNRKIASSGPPVENSGGPPPYSAVPNVPNRKFSVRPATLGSVLVSPIHKQLQRRDRTDSTSSVTK